MMPTEIRSSFLESWEGTTLIETVRDMVNEVSGEEEDGEKTQEPESEDEPDSDEEEEDTFFDLKEMKEHFKTLTPDEREKAKNFESLRNLANGIHPDKAMDEIDRVSERLKKKKEKPKPRTPNPELCKTT